MAVILGDLIETKINETVSTRNVNPSKIFARKVNYRIDKWSVASVSSLRFFVC